MIDYNQWLSQDIGLRAKLRVANEGRAARLYNGLAPLRSALTWAADALRFGSGMVDAYRRRRATRRELARLNDHLLADIGIERKDIATYVHGAVPRSPSAAIARPQRLARQRTKIDIETSAKVVVLRPARHRPAAGHASVPICSPWPAA